MAEYAINREWLESLPESDLVELRRTVDLALRLVEENSVDCLTEAKVSSKALAAGERQFGAMDRLTKQLEDGKITQKKYNEKVHDSIHKNFTDAYASGKGVDPSKLTDGDREWVNRAAKAESEFASKFGSDAAKGLVGKGGKMSRRGRANAYGFSVQAAYWNGKVEAQPDGTRIHWVLGNAEHCEDCILLASQSPYTKWNLPTVPKAGDTRCVFNCHCRLDFRTGKLTAAEKRETAIRGKRREASIDDLIDPPLPPGLRKPSEVEQRYITKLRNQINHHRHVIGSGVEGDALETAIKMRRDLNGELIEFLDKNDIYEVPVFSVDQVVTGEHIGLKAKAEIMRHGLDGATLNAVDTQRLAAMLKRYENAVGETWGDDAVLAALEAEGYTPPVIVSEPVVEAGKKVKVPDFSAVQYQARERGPGRETWVLNGNGSGKMFDLLARVAKAARGLKVTIAPFDDRLIAKVGIWIDGKREDVRQIIRDIGGEIWLK